MTDETTEAANDAPAGDAKTQGRRLFWTLYFVVALIYTVYGTFFGELNHRGFFFNFGMSLVWPFLLFPVLGKLMGALLIMALIFFFVILN